VRLVRPQEIAMRTLPVLALLLSASAIVAQAPMTPPGSPDTKRVTAGTYKIEPNHTQVVFAVDHMGFSIFRGFLSGASGSLVLDATNPNATRLTVTVPTATVHTTVDKLTGELVEPDWLDAAHFPTATFTSTKVTPGPNDTAMVDGTLTLHGVTKPERLMVHFRGAGTNPYTKTQTIGFDGRISIERSQFGVTKLLDLVSDHVEITISAAFEKQP
jgi:polyisoprenoid-binding protein YceI